jgi:hypothetical protein
MVAEFLAGVIVGVLIGLTLAPVLRSWILWQMAKEWRDSRPSSPIVSPTRLEANRDGRPFTG